MKESILPQSLYEQVVIYGDKDSQDIANFFSIFKHSIPQENKNLFVYFINFIKTILNQYPSITKREFINFFSPCFIRPLDNSRRQCDARAINNFLLHFI